MKTGGTRPVLRQSVTNVAAVVRSRREVGISSGKKKGAGIKQTFNLAGVAQILLEEGLNPMAEIVKVMKPKRGKDGKPIHLLDAKTRAAVWMGVLEYVQPKLKSVEMKGGIKLTTEQADAQLSRLLEKGGIPAEAIAAMLAKNKAASEAKE